MLLSDVCYRDSSNGTAERLGNFHSCKHHSVLPQHLSDLFFLSVMCILRTVLKYPKQLQLNCQSACVVGGGIHGFSQVEGSVAVAEREFSPSESKVKASHFCPIWYGMLGHLSHVMRRSKVT